MTDEIDDKIGMVKDQIKGFLSAEFGPIINGAFDTAFESFKSLGLDEEEVSPEVRDMALEVMTLIQSHMIRLVESEASPRQLMHYIVFTSSLVAMMKMMLELGVGLDKLVEDIKKNEEKKEGKR